MAGKNNESWALINLIASVITVLMSIFMFITHKKVKEEAEKQIEISHRHTALSAVSVIISVLSVVFFIRTEDISLRMAWIDSYMIYMAGLMVINIALLIIGKTTRQKKEMEES